MWTNRYLNNVITYWEPIKSTGFPGKVFREPVLIKGRWEDVTEMVVDDSGTEVVSNAKVMVNHPVIPEGYLYLGDSEETDPTDLSGARRIVTVDKAEDLRGSATSVIARLK